VFWYKPFCVGFCSALSLLPFHIQQQPLHHELQVLSRGLSPKGCDFGCTCSVEQFDKVG